MNILLTPHVTSGTYLCGQTSKRQEAQRLLSWKGLEREPSAPGRVVQAGGRKCSARVPHFRVNRGPGGVERKGRENPVQVTSRQAPAQGWGTPSYVPVTGEKRGEETPRDPSRLWSRPQDSGQGLAGTVNRAAVGVGVGSASRAPGLPGGDSGLTWGLNCSRRRCGGQQRPDCSTGPRAGPRGTP